MSLLRLSNKLVLKWILMIKEMAPSKKRMKTIEGMKIKICVVKIHILVLKINSLNKII
jgi:hypothetical protein